MIRYYKSKLLIIVIKGSKNNLQYNDHILNNRKFICLFTKNRQCDKIINMQNHNVCFYCFNH